MKTIDDSTALALAAIEDELPSPEILRLLGKLNFSFLFRFWLLSHFRAYRPTAAFLECCEWGVRHSIQRLEKQLGQPLVANRTIGAPIGNQNARKRGDSRVRPLVFTPFGEALAAALHPLFAATPAAIKLALQQSTPEN